MKMDYTYIIMPHKTYELPNLIPYEQRKQLIEDMLTDEVELHEGILTVEQYLQRVWDKEDSKVTMDIVGYYLSKDFIKEFEEVADN